MNFTENGILLSGRIGELETNFLIYSSSTHENMLRAKKKKTQTNPGVYGWLQRFEMKVRETNNFKERKSDEYLQNECSL